MLEVVSGGSEEFRIVVEKGQALVEPPIQDAADESGGVAVIGAVAAHRSFGDGADVTLVM